jgi:hypothetical protein
MNKGHLRTNGTHLKLPDFCNWCDGTEAQVKSLHRLRNKALVICTECMDLMVECLDEDGDGATFSPTESSILINRANLEQISFGELLKKATLWYVERHKNDPCQSLRRRPRHHAAYLQLVRSKTNQTKQNDRTHAQAFSFMPHLHRRISGHYWRFYVRSLRNIRN